MYFCLNCNGTFDIEKSVHNINIQTDNKISIIEAFKKMNDDDLSKYKPDFTKQELSRNKKYQKLSQEEKNKLNILFEQNTISNAIFKCKSCNTIQPIVETTILYQSSQVMDELNKINNLEENKLLCNDPILPHTNDYICKNTDCITHSKQDMKDAIFYKNKINYKPIYICCVCYFSW